jgi:thioesterase domain-containing protein
MDARIRRHLFLTRLGLPTSRLRHVDDGFALAVRQYVPAPLDVDAVIFRADKSDGDHDPDPTMGWSKLVRGELSVCRVPGDHFTILYEPYVKGLARELTARLEEVAGVAPLTGVAEET